MSRAPSSSIRVAPVPPDSGTTLQVVKDDGDLFPSPPFTYLIWPVQELPTPTNSEQGTATDVTGDEVTLIRPASPITVRAGLLFAALSSANSYDLGERVILQTTQDGSAPFTLTVRRPDGVLEVQSGLSEGEGTVTASVGGQWWFGFDDVNGPLDENDFFVNFSEVE